MKKSEQEGTAWFTTVMAHNKILPKSHVPDHDDSRAEIYIKNPENSTISFSTPIQGDSIPIEYRPLCSEIEKLE